MVLSKRERLVLVLAGVGLALVAVDRLGLEPLLRQRDQVLKDKARKASELQRTQRLLNDARQARLRWDTMSRSGMRGGPAEAEGLIQHAMIDWTQEAGLGLTLLKPDRLTEKARLPVIEFQATGTGTLNSVARLLYRIQTASIPVKVTELQISSRKEGSDELSVQLRLSTIYAPARLQGAASAPAQQAAAPQVEQVRLRSRRTVGPATATTRLAAAATEPVSQPATAPASAPGPDATEAPQLLPELFEEPESDESGEEP